MAVKGDLVWSLEMGFYELVLAFCILFLCFIGLYCKTKHYLSLLQIGIASCNVEFRLQNEFGHQCSEVPRLFPIRKSSERRDGHRSLGFLILRIL